MFDDIKKIISGFFLIFLWFFSFLPAGIDHCGQCASPDVAAGSAATTADSFGGRRLLRCFVFFGAAATPADSTSS